MERTWQLGTIQVDFAMPERFDLSYVGQDGKNHSPVIIHRTAYGSVERFIGIIVENYKGKFPLWLAPVQASVLPMSDKNISYAENVLEDLKENNIRADIDKEINTIEYKVRKAQLQKVNYIIVIGDKEEKNKTISVRTREGKVTYGVKVKDFIEQIEKEVKKFK
jgi:threonyl-tRNA synthetase